MEHLSIRFKAGKNEIPDEKGIYRLVHNEDYSHTFGFQWNRFKRIQLDRFNRGTEQSEERFFAVTLWDGSELSGKNVLEVGSGAGRFTQVLLDRTLANVFSVDSSTAVDANFDNNGPNSRLHLLQASVYDLPFMPHQFDKVICFGVLQHTPEPRVTIRCLAEMVKPGGELVVDFYLLRGWITRIQAKYLFRLWTVPMNPEKLLALIEKNIDFLIRINGFLSKVGLGFLNRFVPLCDVQKTFPSGLSTSGLREWAVLDTFDMFSPKYDKPQKIRIVKKWIEKSGLTVTFAGFVIYGSNNKVAVVKGIRSNQTSPEDA